MPQIRPLALWSQIDEINLVNWYFYRNRVVTANQGCGKKDLKQKMKLIGPTSASNLEGDGTTLLLFG
jgi:hypothetical protein